MQRIITAAIQTNGRIHTGNDHASIYSNYGINQFRDTVQEGFITNDNLFVDRKTAAEIAYESGQIKVRTYELKSYQLKFK